MNCPLETPETARLLVDYTSRKLGPEETALLERHLDLCPACRRFADAQSTVWSALDTWEAAPVSADFDRRLYRRIESENSWTDRLRSAFRPLLAYRGVPAAAAACLVLLAGVLLEHPGKPQPAPVPPDVVMVDVQPEQVEKALDALDVLSEFNRKVRTDNPESKL